MIKNPEYFMAIVESGSLKKAAERLYVSSSYLSQYLKKLEEELGIHLFEHKASPLRLTYAGRQYYDYVLQIIHMTKNLEQEFQDIKIQESGELRIGFSTWRGSIILPTIFPEFHKQYPRIQVRPMEASPNQLISALIAGSLDLVIVSGAPLQYNNMLKKIEFEPIFNEKILLAAPMQQPCVQNILRDYHGEVPYLLTESEFRILLKHIPIITGVPGQALSYAADYITQKYHLKPTVLMEIQNLTTSLNMVSAESACIFLPEAAAHMNSRKEGIAYFDPDVPELNQPLLAVYRKGGSIPRFARLFVKTAKEIYSRSQSVTEN